MKICASSWFIHETESKETRINFISTLLAFGFLTFEQAFDDLLDKS